MFLPGLTPKTPLHPTQFIMTDKSMWSPFSVCSLITGSRTVELSLKQTMKNINVKSHSMEDSSLFSTSIVISPIHILLRFLQYQLPDLTSNSRIASITVFRFYTYSFSSYSYSTCLLSKHKMM